MQQLLRIMEDLWHGYKNQIIIALIGLLIGVFLRDIVKAICGYIGKLLRYIGRQFAWTIFLQPHYYRKYRYTLAEEVKNIPSAFGKQLNLESVYVPVQVSEELISLDESRRISGLDEADKWEQQKREALQKKAMDLSSAITQFHRVAVVGEPGIGKTTALRYLTFMFAQEKMATKRVPIFISLSDHLSELSKINKIEDYLSTFFDNHNFSKAEGFIKKSLDKGRCLILLDGLDEVTEESQHQHVAKLVINFATQYSLNNTNWIIVSSRTESYRRRGRLHHFTPVEVIDFDDKEIYRFIYNWFVDNKIMCERLWAFLTKKENKSIKTLDKNPLLLSLITQVYECEKGEFFTNKRVSLYEKCVDERLSGWDHIRHVHRGYKFDSTDKKHFLREIALQFHTKGERLAPKDTLIEQAKTFLEKKRSGEKATAFFEEIVEGSGLIQEKAIGIYGFSHQTFQEYFSALELANDPNGLSILTQHLKEPHWKEIILLYGGLVKDATPLIKAIYQPEKEIVQSNLILAADCLVDACVEQDTIERITHAIIQNASSIPGLKISQLVELLLSIWKDELPGLIKKRLLSEPEHPPNLFLAAQLLPEIKQDQPQLQQELTERILSLFQNPDIHIRRNAVAALGNVGQASQMVIDALLDTLKNSDADLRSDAAIALGQIGNKDEKTISALQIIFKEDKRPQVHQAVRKSLLQLGEIEMAGMIFIPAGEFLMGSDEYDDEKPPHKVYLNDFYIDRYPVTNAQYKEFVDATKHQAPKHWERGNIPAGKEDHPVVSVSWYDAQSYAEWAGKRLPTEAEWEKAARGIDGRKFPWGNEWDSNKANTSEKKSGGTTPVDAYPDGASPYGVMDMAGNAWEWTSDWYKAYPGSTYKSDNLGGERYKVLRGGSWLYNQSFARCANRVYYVPDTRYGNVGFRCAQ